MSQGPSKQVASGLRTVFGAGGSAGLTDEQLVARFAKRTPDGSAEASFEALLARHGPMVLGVCRALLRDEHAADDAFQATFLVLVRKAGSVRVGDSLGRWLYGVAHKVAVRARADAARERSIGIAQPEAVAEPPCPDTIEAADRRAASHEELARLPESARAAIVLCYLEGLTHEEAALRLGWPVGTVRSRLARGRERLRARLVRRGLAPAPVAAWLAEEIPQTIPPKLVATTTAIAMGAGTVSGRILSLTTGAIHLMTIAKLKTALIACFAAACVGMAGVGVHAYQAGGDDEKTADEPRVAATTPLHLGESPRESAAPAALPVTNVAEMSVLAVQLENARTMFNLRVKLHQTGAVPQQVWEESKLAVRVLEAQILGLKEQLEEELELLEVRLEIKKAELKRAIVQRGQVQSKYDYTKRLHSDKVISNTEVGIAQGNVSLEDAACEVRASEVKEVEVRIKQIQRRLLALDPLVKGIDQSRPQNGSQPAASPSPEK